MTIKFRALALDTLLAMTVATLVLTGGVGLVAGPLGASTDSAFLVPGAAMAALLCGVGLLALCQGWTAMRRLSAMLLVALAGYALVRHGLVQGGDDWLALPAGELRLAVPAWAFLLVVGFCFLVGILSSWHRRFWFATGVSLSLASLTTTFPSTRPTRPSSPIMPAMMP